VKFTLLFLELTLRLEKVSTANGKGIGLAGTIGSFGGVTGKSGDGDGEVGTVVEKLQLFKNTKNEAW
jgi:hypothetical protein